MSSQLLKLLRSLTSPRLQLKLLLVLSSPGYWSSPGRVTEAPFGSKFPGCKYSSIDRLLKPGFHLIAPIVSKNLPAIGKIRMIGAIIRKSLDRLDRPKRAVTQVRGLNLSTFFWRENGFKMAARNRRADLAAILCWQLYAEGEKESYEESTDLNLTLGPVHTMLDKFENATLLLRTRLPSTLIRIKRSTKTELFENAL